MLFLDLLGVRAMNSSPEVDQHLRDLERAISRTYRNFLEPDSPWPAAFFSDTLVLVAPVLPVGEEESAIGGLVIQAAWLQLNLIEAGFFARGGLSVGLIHLREGLLFGPALADAYEAESSRAIHPRIVLSAGAVKSQEKDLQFYRSPVDSPQNAMLLRDPDGEVFINYLGLVLDDPAEDPRPAFEVHRDAISERLGRHRANKPVWEKYRWTAEYHNWVCARRMPKERKLNVSVEDLTWEFSSFA